MTRASWSRYVVPILLVCLASTCLALFLAGAFRRFSQATTSKPDFNSTLQVLIASATGPTPTGTTVAPSMNATAEPSGDHPGGRIVFTCQLYKYQSSEQICIMNADGSGYRRLTLDNDVRHYYPSLSPDGQSVVYSQYREDNVYEIYELNISDGTPTRLTDRLGVLTGPAISPDGTTIAFMRWTPASDQYQIWLMDRDGAHPRRAIDGDGWDPTWSPDGKQLLFASDRGGSVQLYIAKLDGTAPRRITNLPAIRGRSDWSSTGLITTYSGEPWKREIYVMNADGSDAHRISPTGGNSQGPSFSPDGGWVAFTAYFDRFNDINGCEIYIMRKDGTDLRRLTDNEYCDYQPRWGP